MQQPPWRKTVRLSSVADSAENLLARAGFDRGPWLIWIKKPGSNPGEIAEWTPADEPAR